ncbi:hypothetical protein ACFY41_00780 [Streptomyces syringium]|uniref:hypothetical protein n=1 Tax=Streptomyces syringium TaxID=76729 RepID=UPI0036948395
MMDDMAAERDDDETVRPWGPEPPGSPGEQVAAQERAFWEARRRFEDLAAEDDEDGAGEGEEARRERRRLSKQARRLHLNVRSHRYARAVDDGPVPGDLRLPPLPGRDEDFPADAEDGLEGETDGREPGEGAGR